MIGGDEGVPDGVAAAAEGDLGPEVDGEVVGEEAVAAFVEVEEGCGAVGGDPGVEAVAVAVAADGGEGWGGAFEAGGEAVGKGGEVVPGFGRLDAEGGDGGEGGLEQTVGVQGVAASALVGDCSVVQGGEGAGLGFGVGWGVEAGGVAGGFVKQDCGAGAFGHHDGAEGGAGAEEDGPGHRYAGGGEVGDEGGFVGDVGRAAGADTGDAEDEPAGCALLCGFDGVDVVEAAVEEAAGLDGAEVVVGGDEGGDRVGGGCGVADGEHRTADWTAQCGPTGLSGSGNRR